MGRLLILVVRFLQMDREEAEAIRMAKLLEEEKAQFSVSCLLPSIHKSWTFPLSIMAAGCAY